MTTLLIDDVRTSTPPRVKLLTNNTTEDLGGPMDRETAEPDGTLIANHRTGLSGQSGGKVFRWHENRIYEFGTDVYFVPISAIGGSFLTYTEGDAWSTPSANGTFAENGVTGDTFVKVRIIAGSIVASETITINSGPASGQTATADATETQRGSLAQEGEWFAVHVCAATLKAANTHTGLYSGNRGGFTGLGGIYKTSTDELRGVRYTPSTDTWDETGATGVTAAGSFSLSPGKTAAIGSNVYTNLRGASNNNRETAIYDMAANTMATIVTTTSSGAGGQFSLGRQIVDWDGRIFSLGNTGVASSQDISLVELSAGAWQAVPGALFNGASIGGQGVHRGNLDNGTMLVPFQNMMFGFFYAQANTGSSYGWAVLKFTKDSAGNVTSDNMPGDSTAITLTEWRKLAEFLLPSTLAFSLSALPNTGNARWFNYLDLEQNLPDGKPRFLMLHNSDPAGGSSDPYDWEIYDTLSLTLAWPGGTAASQVISVSGGVPSTEISIGDWVYLQADQQIFEVTNVNDAGPDITIANPEGRTLPTASTESRKLRPFSFLTNAGALGEFAYPDDVVGGGYRAFVTGENDVLITGRASELGGERIFFRVYGTGTVKIRMYHGPAINEHPQIESTMSDPSEGSIDGNGDMINVTADDGATEKNFKWEALTDGVTTALSRRRVLRVFS